MIQQQNATVMSMGVSSSPPPSGYDNEDDDNDDDIGMTDEQVHAIYTCTCTYSVAIPLANEQTNTANSSSTIFMLVG